ncbi:MAG TPA: hypothetical protein VJU80_16495 [Solirubrobacteraceae bacterium]|nr:hypothetical protein [Solirubrobacteraceae bacterium]
MNGHDFLKETATVIRTGWCSGADARDSAGKAVPVHDPAARAWSLTAALALVSERSGASLSSLSDALWGISGVIPDWSLDAWNNAAGRSQTEALQMLDDASSSLTRRPPPRAKLN